MKTTGSRKPGNVETRLSIVFMVILVIVGAGVILRQYRINPAVIALRPESRQQALPSGPDQAALVDATKSGISPFSPPERFGPDTLYEKINGRADLYLTSGFVSLDTQRFTMDRTAGNWVELFAYDMATPENAFSVFSMQRREGAISDDTVPNAYRTKNALFMTHQRFYLEIIGTDASEELHRAMGVLARGFVDARGGTTAAGAPGAELFPDEGREAGSLRLITANAFGYEQLAQVYTCEYNINGNRLTAFVSRREDHEAASALAAGHRQTLLSYGATVVNDVVLPDDATVLRFFDAYEIVFSRGNYLAGVHEATDRKAAGILSGRLAAHLEGLTAAHPKQVRMDTE